MPSVGSWLHRASIDHLVDQATTVYTELAEALVSLNLKVKQCRLDIAFDLEHLEPLDYSDSHVFAASTVYDALEADGDDLLEALQKWERRWWYVHSKAEKTTRTLEDIQKAEQEAEYIWALAAQQKRNSKSSRKVHSDTAVARSPAF